MIVAADTNSILGAMKALDPIAFDVRGVGDSRAAA
jgi:hypothetical protein